MNQYNEISTLQYMGSKTRIISHICEPIIKNKSIKTVVDLFAGTGSVGYALKAHKNIISNDLEYYAYIINHAILNGCDFSVTDEISFWNAVEQQSASLQAKVCTAVTTENKFFIDTVDYKQYQLFCEKTPSVFMPQSDDPRLKEILDLVDQVTPGKAPTVETPCLFLTYYGKPRFKYVCPGYRKKECNFKAVDGVLLDEFVVQQLSELSDENSERFRRILEIKIEEVLEQSQTVQEHNLIKKKRDKLKADIAAQTRNLREADGSIKQFIQEDLQNLAEELRETERQLSKLDEGRKNNMIAIRDLEMTKERLLSFAEYAKDAQPEVLVTLIQTIVERIYIVDKDDERYCHIFIKGCSGEDYTGFFQTAGYIEQKTTPECDSEQYCICTEISENGDIWSNQKRYWSDTSQTMRAEGY